MSDLHDRVVLVTGASGFIGSRLSEHLLSAGASVVGVSRSGPKTASGNMRWMVGDLADTVASFRIVETIKPDIVVHLASQVGGSRSLSWVVPTLQSNLLSTVNLLTAVAETGCGRFLLAGSMEEPSTDVPQSPYAASKWAAAGYSKMFHHLYGVDTVNLRIFMVYGPGQWDGTKLIPYVISSILRGESPRLSTGRRLADWVYVDDVVKAISQAAVADDVSGRTVDIGSGVLVSVSDVVDRISQILGNRIEVEFGAVPDRSGDAEHAADPSLARELLGWEAQVPLTEGLERTVRWLEEQGGSS